MEQDKEFFVRKESSPSCSIGTMSLTVLPSLHHSIVWTAFETTDKNVTLNCLNLPRLQQRMDQILCLHLSLKVVSMFGLKSQFLSLTTVCMELPRRLATVQTQLFRFSIKYAIFSFETSPSQCLNLESPESHLMRHNRSPLKTYTPWLHSVNSDSHTNFMFM